MIVYLITNIVNGKKYVGQTSKTIEARFKKHCERAKSKLRKHMPIAMAIAKYGKENFITEKLCECFSHEELNKKELEWATKLKTFSPYGYNLKAGNGNGSMSNDTKMKIKLSNTGKKASLETRIKLSNSHKDFVVSEATKHKLSEINKGKKGTDFCYQRASEVSSKTYLLYDPFGNLTTVHNMKKFCNKKNLSPSKMCEVVRGKKLHHKGWTLDQKLNAVASIARKKYKTNRYYFANRFYKSAKLIDKSSIF